MLSPLHTRAAAQPRTCGALGTRLPSLDGRERLRRMLCAFGAYGVQRIERHGVEARTAITLEDAGDHGLHHRLTVSPVRAERVMDIRHHEDALRQIEVLGGVAERIARAVQLLVMQGGDARALSGT